MGWVVISPAETLVTRECIARMLTAYCALAGALDLQVQDVTIYKTEAGNSVDVTWKAPINAGNFSVWFKWSFLILLNLALVAMHLSQLILDWETFLIDHEPECNNPISLVKQRVLYCLVNHQYFHCCEKSVPAWNNLYFCVVYNWLLYAPFRSKINYQRYCACIRIHMYSWSTFAYICACMWVSRGLVLGCCVWGVGMISWVCVEGDVIR